MQKMLKQQPSQTTPSSREANVFVQQQQQPQLPLLPSSSDDNVYSSDDFKEDDDLLNDLKKIKFSSTETKDSKPPEKM